MRFRLIQTSSGCERIGTLSEFAENPKTEIQTPACALLTQGGSVVHLTGEVLSKVFSKPRLLWVPLSNSINLETGIKAQGKGIAKFAGLPEHITCVTLNNMNEITPAGHFEPDKVPLWTKQGKRLISVDRYMDVMEVFKPDIILAIADSRISLNEVPKKVAKSLERTCSMLDKCVDRYKGSNQLRNSSLIGVIVAPADEKRCNDCLSRILAHKDTLNGVALSGLTDGNEDPTSISVDNIEAVFRRVGDAIPKDMVRFVEGCWNPSVMMSAIEYGWDVLDGSYAVQLTNAGQALALNFDLQSLTSSESCVLDLIDAKYKEDFRPVLEGCECLACKKHTRAYIRHLLNTREMLASVLLSIHNLHHFDQLFHHARLHIAANTFPLYKNLITSQFTLYQPQLNGKAEQTNEIRVKESAVKKKRVSNGVKASLVNGSSG